ncbi:hypothetical protein KL919_002771 [Ogataea angusta]|nr:hypothetical protein KL943_002750 [Ogataea angusta]KAG7860066.1 hypothetical protein KL919_002771 [Ogataea angusta]
MPTLTVPPHGNGFRGVLNYGPSSTRAWTQHSGPVARHVYFRLCICSHLRINDTLDFFPNRRVQDRAGTSANSRTNQPRGTPQVETPRPRRGGTFGTFAITQVDYSVARFTSVHRDIPHCASGSTTLLTSLQTGASALEGVVEKVELSELVRF